jgi:hypothetical protein
MSSNMNHHEARSSRSVHHSNTSTAEKTRERRSIDSNEFDVQQVYESFVAALREPNNPKSPIGTQDYINGYRELLK